MKNITCCKECSCYNLKNKWCDMLGVQLPPEMHPCSTMAPEKYHPFGYGEYCPDGWIPGGGPEYNEKI